VKWERLVYIALTKANKLLLHGSSTEADLGHVALGILGLAQNGLDDADGDGLAHVTHGETAQRRVLGVGLDAHGLGGDHLDDTSLARLVGLGVLLDGLTGTLVHQSQQLVEADGNVGSVAIQNGGVASHDLTGVVHDDDLSLERSGLAGGVVLGVGSDHTTTDVLDGDVLDVEADVVTGVGSLEDLVVHFDGLDLSGDTDGGEGDDHAGLQGAGLDTADGHSADTTDLVNVLQGQTQGLVGGALGGHDGVQSIEQGGALVPVGVGGALKHVVTVEAGDGDEGHQVVLAGIDGLVADLVQVRGNLSADLVVTSLAVVDGLVIHLVHADNDLLDTQGEGKHGVLAGLASLGPASLELTSTRGNHQDGAVSLRGAGNHVLDEVTVARGIDDGEVVLLGLELPQGDIDGDTTLALGLELVQHPGVLERALADVVGLLLELLNGTLVDTTALVDQVAGGGRLAGIDVSNDDQVNVNLFLSHF